MQEIALGYYPSSADIRYAGWLKAFALRLPDYAQRYELTPLQLLEIHSLALEFIELLICQMLSTSDRIRQGHCLVADNAAAEPAGILPWHAARAALQASIGKIIQYIEHHAAYTAADGQALGLPLLSQPPAH